MTNIDIFLKSIHIPGESKTLTKQQEIDLGNIVQDPSSLEKDKLDAINTLVIKNVYLVLKLVHKYKRTSFEFEDLVGYGVLGLFSAARKFQPSKNIRFASYARHWIKESIMKAVREYSGVPKIPVYLVKNLWCVTRIISKNEGISNIDLAKISELPEDTVKYLRSLLFKSVQFDPEYTESDKVTPELIFIQKEYNETFQKALKDLSDKERVVLMHSYQLNGCSKMTFALMEEEFDIEDARSLKASAIEKLKSNNKLRSLRKEY